MNNTNDKLLDILSKTLLLDKSEIKDDLKRKDFEPWDLIIISEVENEFGIFFEDEEVVDIWTVGDLKELLAKKLQD